jgi:hypothetical protein
MSEPVCEYCGEWMRDCNCVGGKVKIKGKISIINGLQGNAEIELSAESLAKQLRKQGFTVMLEQTIDKKIFIKPKSQECECGKELGIYKDRNGMCVTCGKSIQPKPTCEHEYCKCKEPKLPKNWGKIKVNNKLVDFGKLKLKEGEVEELDKWKERS